MESTKTICFSIKALSNQIRRMIDACGMDLGAMTGMQLGVTAYIHKQPADRDIFQRDLETVFNIRRSTATGILQLMEKDGLIRREPVPYDARLKKIVLTESAVELQNSIEAKIRDIDRRLAHNLSDEELDTFFTLIDKIVHNAEAT